MKLNVSVEQTSDDIAKLCVQGDVTIQTSPELRDALKALFAPHQKEIHVDLSGVSFMDSSGIATLVEGLQWARDTQGRFVLHQLQDTVHDVFTLAKLDTVFDIAEAEA